MRYEFKKLFASRLMWVMLLLTFGYMVFIPLREVWGAAGELRQEARAYSEALEDAVSEGISGDGLRARADSFISTGTEALMQDSSYTPKYGTTPMGDFLAMLKSSDTLRYVQRSFESDRAELVRGMVIHNASERRKPVPDSYLIRANEKAIGLYNRRVALEPVSTGIREDIRYNCFNFSSWEYVMTALCVLMTVRLFTLEYTSGAFRLVNTSRRTVQSLFRRKYLTAVLTASAVLTVQAVFELVFCAAVFGLGNLTLPLQQLPMFELCPYSLSIAGFYAIKLPLRILAYTAVISVTALVTSAARRPLVSLAVSLPVTECAAAAVKVLYTLLSDSESPRRSLLGIYDTLRILLPQSLTDLRSYLTGFDCFSLFGYPVPRLAGCAAAALLISAVCAAGGYFASGRIRRKA
ncbi:MAG: hypothetical protein IKP47_05980 [Ruminococcus sp.]|nr:hypothetical protein [Ruminococcus sp.]